jgi:CRISPR-associated protein Csc1
MLLTVCRLTLHDYCFYASREMGRLYETERYLHNYALTYALGLARTPYSSRSPGSHYSDFYSQDLLPINATGVYVTPAYPLRSQFAISTFKKEGANYYGVTSRTTKNDPIYGRAKELLPESVFECYILSERRPSIPHWIRLGKWMAKTLVEVVAQGEARVEHGSVQADGALNPVDLAFVPENCTIISMAPASLITNVFFTGSYYELDSLESRRIRLPVEMRYQPERIWHAQAG